MTQRKARTLYVVDAMSDGHLWHPVFCSEFESDAKDQRKVWAKLMWRKSAGVRITTFLEVLPLPRKRKAKR